MKVNPISVQNFRGILTEKRFVDSIQHAGSYDGFNDRFEPSTYDRFYERDYYPFANETREDIKRAIAPYEGTSYDCGDEETTKIIVKPALNITKSKFQQYKNNDLLSSEDSRIRDMFLRNGLKCFMRENFVRNEDDYTIL